MLRLKNSQSRIKCNSFTTSPAASDHNSLSNFEKQIKLVQYVIFEVYGEVLELHLEDTIIGELQNFFCSIELMMLNNFVDRSDTC